MLVIDTLKLSTNFGSTLANNMHDNKNCVRPHVL
jgi:hypothetical protein